MKNRYTYLNSAILFYILGFLTLLVSCNQKLIHNMDNESKNKLLDTVNNTIEFIDRCSEQAKKGGNNHKNGVISEIPVDKDETEEKQKDKSVRKLFPSVKVKPHKYNLEGLKLEILYEQHNEYNFNKAQYIIQKIYDPKYMIHLELPSNNELKAYENKYVKSKILNECLKSSVLQNKKA